MSDNAIANNNGAPVTFSTKEVAGVHTPVMALDAATITALAAAIAEIIGSGGGGSPSAPTVSSVSSPTITEGGNLVFDIVLSASTTADTTYAYTISGIGGATDADFTGGLAGATFSAGVTKSGTTSGNLTVPSGVSSFTATWETVDDAIAESGNKLSFTVGGINGQGSITDNDAAQTVSLVGDVSANSGSNVVFTVSISAAATDTISVDYATSNGTATAGSDYTATSGTLTWLTGDSASKTITVSTTANASIFEPTEAFTVTLSNALNCNIGTSSATGTINSSAITPTIADDNISVAEEGVTTGWSAGGGTGTITAPSTGKVRFTRGASAYVNYKTFNIPTSNDVVIYAKFHAANVSGTWGQIVFGAGATTKFELNFGYNVETLTSQLGTLSSWNYQTNTGNVVATGLTADTDVEVAVHIDRNRNCVSVYYKDATGNWKFGSGFAGTTVFSACTRLSTSSSNSTGSYVELDYVIACRPNIVSIGDSICAGHNSFDPDVSFYAGEDNNNTSWQYWAKIYPSLRNNLIVNKGVGGNTSAQILARIAEATAHTPRVVIVQASNNDEVSAISQATRTSNMQSTINAITAASASAVLINGLHATSASSDNTPTPDLRDYMITSWTTHVPTLTGLSLAIDTMTPLKDGSNFLASGNSSDGVHLNATGAQLFGEYIEAEMV